MGMEIKMLELALHGDERGLLVAAEGEKDIPFEIKRVYYITGAAPEIRRGFHAHKELRQVLFCINGSCMIHLDDGFECREVLLDRSNVGLCIDKTIWREMYDFSPGAVLLVFASERYDENDYIRDYDKFIEYVRKGKK